MKYLRSFAVGIFEGSGCDGRPRAVDDLPDRLETVWLCDADDMAAMVLSNRPRWPAVSSPKLY